MKKMIPFSFMLCAVLLLALITGCGSTGNSGSYYNTSSSYHHTSWNYDNDYRSGYNDHYNRPAAKAHVISEGGARSGGGRAGGRGGGGGRR